MSDIEKAARDAVEAADNTELVRQIVVALQVQQALNGQQQPACQHQAPKSTPNVGKWAAIAVAGSVAAISLALSAIAVAVGAVAVTCCLLVLRGLWADFQKGRR
ncbi:hypothetical protein [Streptomyces regalis]|uniref:Uncharacterized protein n=1 Tax=Streptomyces regalis TaxID=68262 RepID=A0A101JGZ9_9ACTN|nr:hypothetical protein [Streptomyces regalis]KUL26663.1 hypothetical protein ADL12_32225 [Streptomyces regalis]